MDPSGTFARNLDESLVRERPHLRIAPLREPVSSRSLRIPLTLEPNASGIREPSAIPKPGAPAGILPPRNEPGAPVLESSNRPKKSDYAPESLLDPLPRLILPAFVNPRALERFPYSSFDDDSLQSRKRRRVDFQSESFGEHLQLPIPQAQKEQRPPPFGPFAILNGLNEPPPNAALLPPIEAGSITQLLTKPSRDSTVNGQLIPEAQNGERREGRIADILDAPIVENSSPKHRIDKPTTASELERAPQPIEGIDAPLSPKTRGRSRKNIRKWSDEETVALLHGVLKCGIGNWKEILAQPELVFNKRSASNLKDRFRVCCPCAYRASDPEEALRHLHDALSKIMFRLECDNPTKLSHITQHFPETSSSTRPPDLTHSGSSSSFSSLDTNQNSPEHYSQGDAMFENIPLFSNRAKAAPGSLPVLDPPTPAKSRRRSRHPFTAAEDEALLKGYAVHGFQWTLIQQDKRLGLGHRRATDLRDRFRTKFPHAYRDGGSVSANTLQAQMSKDALKDETNGAPGSKQNIQCQNASDTPKKCDKPAVDPVLPSIVHPLSLREPASTSPFPLDENSSIVTGVDLPPLWDDDLS
ncbi:hypothetical protein BJY04DRAFT_181898 [Aspergillus karnatakaensis]|uniref:telomere repeat binding factor family protein n=1 Tax=Aspergillus karnatakaensis TaxID=1810916 RepID=UPI003CCE2FBA